MTTGSVSHLDEAKKDLAWKVHMLDRLESSPDRGAIVHHNSESSLVVEVKSKQHLDKPLMEFKKVLLGKLNESFSLGGGCVKVPRDIVCSQCIWVEGTDPRRSPCVLLLNSFEFDQNVP